RPAHTLADQSVRRPHIYWSGTRDARARYGRLAGRRATRRRRLRPASYEMTTLSTHVLDIERGAPAAGVPIALYRGEQPLAQAETNADGRIADLAGGGSLDAGSYRLVFDVAAYFARQGRAAPFLERVSIDFQ